MSDDPRLIDPGSSGEYGWHTLADWLTCPRLAALKRANGRDEPSEAQLVGTMVHVGLAHRYALMQGQDVYQPADAVERFARKTPDATSHVYTTQAALASYAAHYGPEADIETLAVEKVFRMKIMGCAYTQRLDLVYKRRGKVYIVDHKKTYAILPKVTRGYGLSGQMVGASLYGQKKWGEKFGGVLLNFVRLAKGDNNYEFKRLPVAPFPYAVRSFSKTVVLAHEMLDRYKDADPYDVPGVFTEACYGKYGPCQFYDICRMGKP